MTAPMMPPERMDAPSQLAKLDALIRAATAAREEARTSDLFGTVQGLALTNAIYDLTEIDAVYDWAEDLRRELGLFVDEPPSGSVSLMAAE